MHHQRHIPPKGWKIVAGALEPDRTLVGYQVRDQDVRGRCYQKDCRRNCHVDHARMIANGLGALTIDQVKALMRCNRIEGCGLEFIEDRRRETLQIASLLGRPAVKIRMRCSRCRNGREAPPEAVIGRLQAEGKGDGATLIAELAKHLTAPCKTCGPTSWVVDVAWPDPATTGGKRKIEQAIAELERGKMKDPLDF